MSRLRVEGLLAAFPKLVSAGKQHTFVETENVRYLYQPLEVRGVEERGGERRETRVARPARMRKKKTLSIDRARPPLALTRPRAPGPPHHPTHLPQNMYLLLVTNKGSNILEDLETLRLLGKVNKKRENRARSLFFRPPCPAPRPFLTPLPSFFLSLFFV